MTDLFHLHKIGKFYISLLYKCKSLLRRYANKHMNFPYRKTSKREVKTGRREKIIIFFKLHLTNPDCQTKLVRLDVKPVTALLNERSQLPYETGSYSKLTVLFF